LDSSDINDLELNVSFKRVGKEVSIHKLMENLYIRTLAWNVAEHLQQTYPEFQVLHSQTAQS